jgi:hypothetical protein
VGPPPVRRMVADDRGERLGHQAGIAYGLGGAR